MNDLVAGYGQWLFIGTVSCRAYSGATCTTVASFSGRETVVGSIPTGSTRSLLVLRPTPLLGWSMIGIKKLDMPRFSFGAGEKSKRSLGHRCYGSITPF